MLRRHCWFMPASTSSSLRGSPSGVRSGTQKLYCGWPAANPPSTACGAPAELQQLGDHPGTGLRPLGRRDVAEPAHGLVGDACLHGRRVPAAGDHRRAHPDAERAGLLQVAHHRGQPDAQVRGLPVDHRTLGEVGEVALDLRQLAVEHQPGPHGLLGARPEPAQRLAPPLALHRAPGGGLQEAGRPAPGRQAPQEVEVLLGGDGADGQPRHRCWGRRRGRCWGGVGGGHGGRA